MFADIHGDTTVKTITLSEDAYVALAQVKKEGESFSDVVLRLARGRRSLLEFAGDWKDFPEEKMPAYVALLEAGGRFARTKLPLESGRRKPPVPSGQKWRSSSIIGTKK